MLLYAVESFLQPVDSSMAKTAAPLWLDTNRFQTASELKYPTNIPRRTTTYYTSFVAWRPRTRQKVRALAVSSQLDWEISDYGTWSMEQLPNELEDRALWMGS